MPNPNFEKYDPNSPTPWKPENPGTAFKGLGDRVYESLQDIVLITNLRSTERKAGGINEQYYRLLSEQFFTALGSERSKLTPELIDSVFKMVERSHPPLIAMFHGEERRDRPVEDRIRNAQDQSRVLKETILRMLTDTK